MARNAEARIQASIVEWIGTVAPQVVVFHPPNGGLRTKSEAALLKWIGTVAGIPDLVIFVPGGRAFCLEVKSADGRVTPEQREMMIRLNSIGVSNAVVRSIEDVRLAFDAWDISTREAAGS
jgi:hypothetical protein